MHLRRILCSLLVASLFGAGLLFAQDAPRSFDIPAGRADRMLERFARQAGQSAIFPTELIRSVRTQAVKGSYTAVDALALMLQGTDLVAVRDAQTGTLLIKPANARNDYVVELPPYTVEGAQVPVSWQYASLPGVELLSRCSDATSQLLLYHHFRLRNTLTALLPEEFQVRLDMPITYVLFDSMAQTGGTRELTKELEKHRPGVDNWLLSGMSNYRFGDRDAVALFFVLDELSFSRGRLTITPEYFHFMLSSRTPTLPAWFIAGMTELYQNAILESVPPGRSTSSATVADPPLPEGVLALRPVLWGTEEETQELKRNPEQEVQFLPMSALFGAPPDAAVNPGLEARWRQQAALFIRWALDGGPQHPQREALWRFVRRCSVEPATEAVFVDCFGDGFAKAENHLRDYLEVAIRRRAYLRTEGTYDPPVATLREATESEISRLKGRLDRLEIAYVRENCPELTPRYINQARRTLHRAYAKGERDPRLLAELGLCECEAGDDVAARPFLEAAVAGKVVHPRAYYELARIYYQELLARPDAARLTIAEAGRVLQPVAMALKQSPPLAEAYGLIAEVWLRADGRLIPAQLAVLDEGLRLFPSHGRLLYSAALLNSLHGDPAKARALVLRGLAVTTDTVEQERFRKLEAALAAEAADATTGSAPATVP